jgi:hypothetical protein
MAAKERDEYDPATLRAEMDAMRAERAQERSEVAMLRAQVQRYEDTAKETDEQKRKFAEFLDWVALSAEQKTQIQADKKFASVGGEPWEVQLPEHPKVRLPAHSEYEAIGRYNEICGITATAHKHICTPIAPQTQAA